MFSKSMNVGVLCVCAGTGAQLPWNWKLPQIQNPFAEQVADTAGPRAVPSAAVTATPPQPEAASPALPVKQEAASKAELPWKQDAAEQVQWPGWRMGSRGVKVGGAASHDAAPKEAEQQQQQGVSPVLRMPQWKNPFEGWGERAAPGSA